MRRQKRSSRKQFLLTKCFSCRRKEKETSFIWTIFPLANKSTKYIFETVYADDLPRLN